MTAIAAVLTTFALHAADSKASYRVYVTNELSGDLSIIDGGTHKVLASLQLGKRPRGIQLSPDGKLLYVALSGSPIAPPGVDESTLPPPDRSADGIGVVDIASRRLLRVVRGVSDPEQLVPGPKGERLFVASEDTGTAVIQDADTGKVIATLPVGGEPEGVAIRPDGRFVYMTSEEDHQVSVIDTATNRKVTQFEVGLRPRAAVFSPDGSRAYVTGENDGTLTVVDAQKHEVIRTVKLPGQNVRPMGVDTSPDGSRIYVAAGRGKTLLSLDAKSFEVLGSVEVGPRPWGVAVSPDGRYAYTANGPSNDVSVVDTRTMKLVTKVPVGRSPWGVITVQ